MSPQGSGILLENIAACFNKERTGFPLGMTVNQGKSRFMCEQSHHYLSAYFLSTVDLGASSPAISLGLGTLCKMIIEGL